MPSLIVEDPQEGIFLHFWKKCGTKGSKTTSLDLETKNGHRNFQRKATTIQRGSFPDRISQKIYTCKYVPCFGQELEDKEEDFKGRRKNRRNIRATKSEEQIKRKF